MSKQKPVKKAVIRSLDAVATGQFLMIGTATLTQLRIKKVGPPWRLYKGEPYYAFDKLVEWFNAHLDGQRQSTKFLSKAEIRKSLLNLAWERKAKR